MFVPLVSNSRLTGPVIQFEADPALPAIAAVAGFNILNILIVPVSKIPDVKVRTPAAGNVTGLFNFT